MKPKPGGGNGSGKFESGQHDMGGWVLVCTGRQHLPEDLPVFLSQALSDWFRQRPQLRMRCVVPIHKDGNTVELHAEYDAHLFRLFRGQNQRLISRIDEAQKDTYRLYRLSVIGAERRASGIINRT